MNKKIEYFISECALENENYIIHYNFDSGNIFGNKIKNIGYYPNFSGNINTGIISEFDFNEAFNKNSGYIYIDGEKIKNISIPYSNTNNISGIFAGKNFSIALQTNKEIISWGEQLNEYTDFIELNDSWGQTISGNNLNNIKDISINSMGLYVLALLDNGQVTGWGKNNYSVSTGGNNINSAVKISAGFDHGLALLEDGTVTGWGNNDYGQISNLSLVANATGVFAGSGYSLILKQNGTITGFGINNWGQISDCQYLDNVKNISAGVSHAFAILNNNKITGWGNNTQKQVANIFSVTNNIGVNYTKNPQLPHDLKFLGDWNITDVSSLNNVKKISAGYNNTLVLFQDGTVTGWGNDDEEKISQFLSAKNIKDISAGYIHSLAINDNNKILGYGNDDANQKFGFTDFYKSLEKFDNSRFSFILNYEKTGSAEGIILSTMYSGQDNRIYGFNLITNAYNNLAVEYYDENQDYILEESNFNLNTKGILSFIGNDDKINIYYLNASASLFENASLSVNFVTPFIENKITLGKTIYTRLKQNIFEGFIKDFVYINFPLDENQLSKYCNYFINDFNYYYTTSLLGERYIYEDVPPNNSIIIEPFTQISNNCLDINFFEKSGENYGYITGYVSGTKNVITGSVLKLYYDVRDQDFTRQIKLLVKTGEDIELIDSILTEVTGELSYTGLQIYDVCNNENINVIFKQDLLRTYTTQLTGAVTDLFEEKIVNVTVKSGEPYITGETIVTGKINDSEILENYRFNPIIDIVSDDKENYNNALILFQNGVLTGYGYNQNGQVFGITELNNLNEIWTGNFENSLLTNLKNISGVYTSQNYSSGQKSLFLNSEGVIETGFGVVDQYGILTGGKNLSGIIKIAIGNDFVLAILSDNSLTGWGNNSSGFVNPEKYNSIDGTWTGDWSSTYLGSLEFQDIQTVNSGTTLAVLSDGTVTGWGLNQNGLICGINDYELGFPFYLKITGIRNDLIDFTGNLLSYTGFYNNQPAYTDILNFNSSLFYSGNNNWVLEYRDLDIKILLTGAGILNENSQYISVPINNSSEYPKEIYISNAVKENINGKYVWDQSQNIYTGGYIIETGITQLDIINRIEFSGLSVTDLNGSYIRLSGGNTKFTKEIYLPNFIILDNWGNDDQNLSVDEEYFLTGSFIPLYGNGETIQNIYLNNTYATNERYIYYDNNQWNFISSGVLQWYNITTNSGRFPLTGWEIINSLGSAGVIHPSSNPDIWFNGVNGWALSKYGQEDGETTFDSIDLITWEDGVDTFDGNSTSFYIRLTGVNDFRYEGYYGFLDNQDIYYIIEKRDEDWVYYTSNNIDVKETGIGGDYPWNATWDNINLTNESIYRTYTIKQDANNGNIWGIFYDKNRYYYNTGSINSILPINDWISSSTDGIDYLPYAFTINESTNANFLVNKVYYYSGYSFDYSDNVLRPIYTGINNSYLKYIEEISTTGWKISNHNLNAFKISSQTLQVPETGTFTELKLNPLYSSLISQSSIDLEKSFAQFEKLYDTQANGLFSGDYTLTPIGNLTNVQKIVLSKNHAICLFADGTITGWGLNNYNQVANLNPQNYYNNSGQWTGDWSYSTLTGLSGIKDIFVGENTSFALLESGVLTGWGKNVKFDPNFNGIVWSGDWNNSILKNITGIKKVIGKKENYNIILFENGKVSGFGSSSDIDKITGLNNSTIQNEIYYNYDFSIKNLAEFRTRIEKIENLKFKNENITPLKEYSMSKITSIGYDRIIELNKQINFIKTFGVEEVTINKYLDPNDWVEIYNFNINEGYNISVNQLAYISNSSNNIFVGENSISKFLTFNGVGQLEAVDYEDLNNEFISPNLSTDLKDLIDINRIRTGDFSFEYTGQALTNLNPKDFIYLNGQKLISGYHYNFSINNIHFNTENIPATGLIYSFDSLLPYVRHTGKGQYYYNLNKRFQKYTNMVWLNGLKLQLNDYLETSYNDYFFEPEFKNVQNQQIYSNENSYFNI